MIVDARIHIGSVISVELYKMFNGTYTLDIDGDIDITLTREQVEELFERMKELQIG